jgi:hypothetical protein
MIAPHKCFLITYLLIAQFVEWIINLQEIKKNIIILLHVSVIRPLSGRKYIIS